MSNPHQIDSPLEVWVAARRKMQEGEETKAHLSAPYTPPTAEQLRFAGLEDSRQKSQAADRGKRLVAMRERHALELEREPENTSLRMKHLMEQADLLSSLATGARPSTDAGTTSKASAPPKAATKQGRRRAGRLSEKEEDEMLLKMSDANAESGGGERQTRLSAQPACITGRMRPYQLEGLNWLIRAYESGVNGVLADEMGLGKTLQTISLMAYLKETHGLAGPYLVIAPKSTLGNWFNEVRRWCPALSAFKFHGDKEARKRIVADVLSPGEWDVCITTYEVVISEKRALMQFDWRCLIIDEAHRIKNEASVLSQTVRLFTVGHRLLITGTPLQNNLRELWAMLNFLLPDAFNDADAFDRWMGSGDGSGDTSQGVIGNLHKLLKPVLLRRLKSEVEKDLPPKKELKLFVGLSEMQRYWYGNILSKNIDALNDVGANKVRMLNILMQLRKCCNHPYLFDGAEQPPFINDGRLISNCGKFGLLDKLLPRLRRDGHRVLIFSQAIVTPNPNTTPNPNLQPPTLTLLLILTCNLQP